MSKINNIDWIACLNKVIAVLEKDLQCKIFVDKPVILDIDRLVNLNISKLDTRPNIAKIAGQLTYWLSRLKPCRISLNSTNNFLAINELLAFKLGLYICNTYKDDYSKQHKIKLASRIFFECLENFRYGNYSQETTTLLFEILTSEI